MRPPTVRDATLAGGTITLANTTSLDRRDSQVCPSKFVKLDDEKGAPFSSAGLAASSTNEIAGSSGASGQNSNFEAPNTENQNPQV